MPPNLELLDRALLLCRDRSPFLRRDIGYMFRERSPVAPRVLHGVLPLPEWHLRWRLQYPRAALPGMLEMLFNVRDMHNNILADFVRSRSPKLAPLTS